MPGVPVAFDQFLIHLASMASRRLVPAAVREALLGIPSDIASLERNYLLSDDDLDLIGTRRSARRTASGWRSTSHCCAIRAKAGTTTPNRLLPWSPGFPYLLGFVSCRTRCDRVTRYGLFA